MAQLEQICSRQPAREEVERKLRAIQSYREELGSYQMEESEMAVRPEPPVPPELFRGMTLEQAEAMIEKDSRRYELLTRTKPWLIFTFAGWMMLVLSIPSVVMKAYPAAGILAVMGFVLLIIGAQRRRERHREAKQLEEKYGSEFPEAWMMQLRHYEAEKKKFDQALLDYRVARGDLDIRNTFLQKQRESLFGSQLPEKVQEIWQQMLKQWDAYEAAGRDFQQAEKYLQTLQNMVQPGVKPPAMEDILVYPAEETQSLLAEARAEQQRLQNRLGQYQGRMEALGRPDALQGQLGEVERRIERLEDIYGAVTLALETLAQARQELQRKFAPRISKRAQELLAKMTAGRYDRLTLSEDLSLLAGAAEEETLREILWRSDGTVDQLYLALRLAVAEELIPDAPLVLDDAFVRFDDTRLNAAVDILKEEAGQKQVILFTCQHREKALLA